MEKCFDIQNNMPLVPDAQTILDIEKYHSHSKPSLKYNPTILVSALLLSLARIHLRDFVTHDPRVILDLRESIHEEKTAFVNKILEHTMTLHKLVDENAGFDVLLNESEFVAKTEIIPAFENAKVRYQQEMNKSLAKKFITVSDRLLSFGFSAFTLNYSAARESLSGLFDISSGKALHKQLMKSGESYSNYCYLLRIEQEAN